MPRRGPKGEKRPADVIGNEVLIARIATGQVEDDKSGTSLFFGRQSLFEIGDF
jgi:hypothetical protein